MHRLTGRSGVADRDTDSKIKWVLSQLRRHFCFNRHIFDPNAYQKSSMCVTSERGIQLILEIYGRTQRGNFWW